MIQSWNDTTNVEVQIGPIIYKSDLTWDFVDQQQGSNQFFFSLG